METAVPPIAIIEPNILRWLPSDSLEPKRIRVIPARDVVMTLTSVKSSDPDVSAQIVPGARSGEFAVMVTPHTDRRTFSGSLRIETDFPKAHPKGLASPA